MSYPKLTPIIAKGATEPRYLEDRFADVVNVKNFGAVGDGVTNDTSAILAAIDAGEEQGKKLIFEEGKTYKLTGSTVEFKTGAEFNNCVLDISEMTGNLYLNSPNTEWVEDSDALSAVRLGSNLPAQTIKIPALATYTSISNKSVRIVTNQYYFTYRGTDQTRLELNRVTDRGQLLSPIKYGLDVSKITAIKIKEYNKKQTKYKNVMFRFGDRVPTNEWIIVGVYHSSNVYLENISFDVTPNTVFPENASFTLFSVLGCDHVEVNGLYFPAPIVNSYGINLDTSYDVTIRKAVGQGAGWGITGNNYCWRIVFDSCDLNRVDFHMPFFEYMKILNCNVFTHGVTVSAVGDLIVNNTVFHKDTSVLGETPLGSIFFARDELAGLSDGSLLITNCKVINNIENTKLISCSGRYSDITKSESPLAQIFWHNVIVENLVCEGSYPLNLAPTVFNNNAPFNIVYNGVYGDVLWKNSPADEGTSLVSSDADMHITKHTVTLRDIPSLKLFSLLCSFATNYEVRRSVVLENVHNINDSSGAVSIVIRGYIDLYIDKSDISSIISCNTANNTGLENILVNKCRINTQNNSYPFVFPNAKADISFSNCIFLAQPTLDMFTGTIADPSAPANNITGVFGHIKFSGNTVISKLAKLKDKNAIIIYDWLDNLENEKTVSLPVGFFTIPGVNTYFVHLGYSDEYQVACCKPFSGCFETHYFKPNDGSSDVYVTFLAPYSTSSNQGSVKANTSVRMLSLSI